MAHPRKTLGVFTIRIDNNYTRRELPGGGYTNDRAPDSLHEVQVSIDLQALAQRLGYRAVHGKSGKASALAGAVMVEHLGKKEAR